MPILYLKSTMNDPGLPPVEQKNTIYRFHLYLKRNFFSSPSIENKITTKLSNQYEKIIFNPDDADGVHMGNKRPDTHISRHGA